MTCPNCGTPVLSGVSSCRSCGASLERKAVPSYLEPPVAQVPPVIQAPYAPPMGRAPAEPRRWEDVSSLRTPLLVLLVADAVLAPSTMVVPLVGLPYALLFVVTAVVFLVWLHRARRNAAAGTHQLAPGWVFGGWFVPGANFYLPWRVVHDVGVAAVAPDRRGTVTGPVAVWWCPGCCRG